MPLVPGCVPVASAAALTRVTVGNTAWLFTNSTPSARSRSSVGGWAAVMASGRRPSTTKTMTNRAVVGMAGRSSLLVVLHPAPTVRAASTFPVGPRMYREVHEDRRFRLLGPGLGGLA